MCLSPDAYVGTVVYDRLVRRGVDPQRARAVARKVQTAYALKRRDSAGLTYAPGDRSHADRRVA